MDLENPTIIKNVLTKDEIRQLLDWSHIEQLKGSFAESSIAWSYITWPIRQEHEAYHIICNAITKHIVGHDNWEWIGSRFNKQERPGVKIHKDDAHAEDTPQNERYTIVMNLGSNYRGSTVVFNQTHYGNYHFDYWHYLSNRQQGKGEKGEEVNDLEDGFVISEKDYNKHLRHIPKKKLEGLSIKKVVDWRSPGDASYFRSNNLHSPGYSEEGNWKIAAATLIKIYK